MKAMVLAAGFGTRLRPYTLKRPKPLFPVAGTPLLSHILAQLRAHGADSILVNAHHLREQIVALMVGQADVAVQQEEIELGTGGGLRLACSFFDARPALAVNGDICHDIDLARVYHSHCQSGADVTMVLHDCPRFNTVWLNDDSMVTAFGQKTGAPGRCLAFAGIHVINPEVLRLMPEGQFYNIIDCYKTLIAQGGRVAGLVVRDHYWTDMGTPEDYLGLHGDILKNGRLPGFLDYREAESCLVGKDVRLGRGVQLADWVSIGDRAEIGAGARLSRVVVWDGAVVEPGAVLSDIIVM